MGYSEVRGKCGKCGEEYTPYLILFEDNLAVFFQWLTLKDQYGWLCPECFNEEMRSCCYAIINQGQEAVA